MDAQTLLALLHAAEDTGRILLDHLGMIGRRLERLDKRLRAFACGVKELEAAWEEIERQLASHREPL